MTKHEWKAGMFNNMPNPHQYKPIVHHLRVRCPKCRDVSVIDVEGAVENTRIHCPCGPLWKILGEVNG